MRTLPSALAFGLTMMSCALARPGAAQSRAHDPSATQSTRMGIIIDAAERRGPAAGRSRIIAFLPDCRRLIDLDRADSAAIAAAPVPLPDVPAARRTSSLVLTLVHLVGERPECDVTGITLRRGDREVAPVAAVRGPVGDAVPEPAGDAASNSTGSRRLAFASVAVDVADLAPGPDGLVGDLILDVHVAATGAPKSFEIPWSDLRTAWLSLLDLGKLPAEAAERRAALGAAGLDRLAARDTVAARVIMSQLVADDPCIQLAASFGLEERAFVAGMYRRPTRCTAQSSGTTILRSALLPGFGRPVEPEARSRRAAIAVGVGVSTLATVYMWDRARAAHEDYLDILELGPMDPSGVLDKLRSREVRTRTLSHLFLAVASATWATQFITTVRAERLHELRIEAVSGFDPRARSRNLSWAPIIGPSALGVSLTLHW